MNGSHYAASLATYIGDRCSAKQQTKVKWLASDLVWQTNFSVCIYRSDGEKQSSLQVINLTTINIIYWIASAVVKNDF